MLNSELSAYTNEQLSEYTNYELATMLRTLVTDRTSLDVERWKYLRDKGWDKMDPLERQEWMGEINVTPSAAKGMYTHVDMNRVEGMVETILVLLQAAGYNPPKLITKTDWTYKDTVWNTDIERYYGNISVIRDFVTTYASTPKAPRIGDKLTYRIANDIEKILMDVHEIITHISESWHYAGETQVGEV